MKLAHRLACPRVRACRRFASHPVLRVEVFFAEPVGRELKFLRSGESGVSRCLHTTPWTTQKSTSMTVGDVHRQVGADTHTMLPLPETWLPGMAHLLTSYACLVDFSVLVRNSLCWEMVDRLSKVIPLANQSWDSNLNLLKSNCGTSKNPCLPRPHVGQALTQKAVFLKCRLDPITSHFKSWQQPSSLEVLLNTGVTDDQGAGKVHGSALRGTWQRQVIDWPCVSCQLSRVLDVC